MANITYTSNGSFLSKTIANQCIGSLSSLKPSENFSSSHSHFDIYFDENFRGKYLNIFGFVCEILISYKSSEFDSVLILL